MGGAIIFLDIFKISKKREVCALMLCTFTSLFYIYIYIYIYIMLVRLGCKVTISITNELDFQDVKIIIQALNQVTTQI